MFYPHKIAKCPFCSTTVRFEVTAIEFGDEDSIRAPRIAVVAPRYRTTLEVVPAACPECGQCTLVLETIAKKGSSSENITQVIWPDSTLRPPPDEVEAEAPKLAADFREAVAVLPKSKKASAALSRRCLQYILREKGGTTSDNLSEQIKQVINKLPPELGDNVDAIRQIGNFASHPIKDTNSGEVVDVEEGEAEWSIEILEALFDFYYVAPAKARARQVDLNKKLASMNKPELKTPTKP